MVNLIVILDIRAKRWRTPEQNPKAILDVRAKRLTDTRINRLTRWLTGSVSHLFTLIIMIYHFQENVVLARSSFCVILLQGIFGRIGVKKD